MVYVVHKSWKNKNAVLSHLKLTFPIFPSFDYAKAVSRLFYLYDKQGCYFNMISSAWFGFYIPNILVNERMNTGQI
jgi:hypothetical protein